MIKNILVTGGCGFIGSNFIRQQIKNNKNHIINFDKLTYAGNPDNLKSVIDSNRYTFIKGDICDKKKVLTTLLNSDPDAIVHFAAESHVDRSIDNPIEFINTNVVGTATLLESSLKYLNSKNKPFDTFRFVHVSTDEVFGSLSENGLFTEQTPYDPSSPYSASKASSDHLVSSYVRTFKIPAIITNCSNNYGPRQHPEKLIPKLIHNILNNKSLPIYGKGTNSREWIYVKDHCEALLKVFHKGKIGEFYNIGSNKNFNNIEICNHLINVAKKIIKI